MSRWKTVLGITAVLFAAYIVAAPYITVHQMSSAAENHNGEALSEHVEFPSVRQSIKDQMNAMFVKRMAESDEMKSNAFAVFGAALVGVMVDKMVDAFVTPAGITQLMAGEKPQPQALQDEESSSSTSRKPFSDASMSYESFNKFVVTVESVVV